MDLPGYGGISVGLGAAGSSPYPVRSLGDLEEMSDSPMTNRVIAAFRSRTGAPLASPKSRSGADAAPLLNPFATASHRTVSRTITIGDIRSGLSRSRSPSPSPPPPAYDGRGTLSAENLRRLELLRFKDGTEDHSTEDAVGTTFDPLPVRAAQLLTRHSHRGVAVEELFSIVDLLSMISKRAEAPRVPDEVAAAYVRCVSAGSYFVKYPHGKGHPHHRFVRLCVSTSEIYGPQPFLEYKTHARAVGVSGRQHLACLAGVNVGLDASPCFSSFRVPGDDASNMLYGPLYDGHRTTLNGNLTFTVVFVSLDSPTALISLLTLASETFEHWLTVLRFLANVNVHENDLRDDAALPPLYAAPLRPSHRRSSSEASTNGE